jgi:myo-inositol-1(or 4)-monophosphatase
VSLGGTLEAARAVQACRRVGAASLDLDYTAAGAYDGTWEMQRKPWDLTAGALLVTEAGGRVSDFSGRGLNFYGREWLASNCRIHDQLSSLLQRRGASG